MTINFKDINGKDCKVTCSKETAQVLRGLATMAINYARKEGCEYISAAIANCIRKPFIEALDGPDDFEI